jgi:hypothetical protein
MSIELEHISVILPRVIKRIEGEKMEWINVEDKLPKEDVTVLTFSTNYPEDPVIFEYLVCMSEDGEPLWYDSINVTHWMPLPEPPK